MDILLSDCCSDSDWGGSSLECGTWLILSPRTLPFCFSDWITDPKKGRLRRVFVSSSTSVSSSRTPEMARLTSGPASCRVLRPAWVSDVSDEM